MTPLKEAIEQTAELGKKLRAENPTIHSISFQLIDFPVDEVREVAKVYKSQGEYSAPHSRVGFLVSVNYGEVYIHVYSIEVKAKVVYE